MITTAEAGAPARPDTHVLRPQVQLGWSPAGAEVEIVERGDWPRPAGGLAMHWRGCRPAPAIVEAGTDVVLVFGNPVLGERIDRAGAARWFLSREHPSRDLAELNGEFLIVHADLTRRRLRVVNDRYASIPFYYARLGERLLGSLAYADLWLALGEAGARRTREESVFEFMWLQRLLGEKTYDSASRFLPAATLLTADGAATTLEAYWRPDFAKTAYPSLDAAADALIGRLARALERKTSDGPRLGLFLSGGMDTRTVLAACGARTVSCVTVAFSENREGEIARTVAAARGAPHTLIVLPVGHYGRILDDASKLCGGMYAFDHALFLGLRDQVAPLADVVLHGHGLDYMFQGMYLPVRYLEAFGRRTFIRRLEAPRGDLAEAFLRRISYRLKRTDLLRYVRPAWRARLTDALRQSVEDVIARARPWARTPFDLWEYLLMHALSRHYTNPNVSSIGTCGEQRTLTFDNDVFALYLSMPERYRLAARVLRRALRRLDARLAALPSANTGLRIDSSPLSLTAAHAWRRLRGARHPQAADRTWPDRDRLFREDPRLRRAVRDAARSEVLAAHAPFLDLAVLGADLERRLEAPAGGGDLMATVVTLNEFFRGS
ncbi:MAG TPA: asparagine synthase-related protein [bacterium]